MSRMERKAEKITMLNPTTLTVGDAPALSNTLNCEGSIEGTFFLDVSAIKAGGTADLQVIINTYDPVSGSPIQLVAFTSTAIVGTEAKNVSTNLGYQIEAEATISGGAPADTLTFTVGVVLKS